MMSAWGLWAYMFTYFFVILYAHSILIIMSLSPYLFPLLLLMVINVEDKRIEEIKIREIKR